MRDEDHLNVLGIVHYLLAGFVGFFSLLTIFYLLFGILMLAVKFPPDARNEVPPEKIVGWMFIVIGGIGMLFGIAYTTCIVLMGRCLRMRRWRTFCIVMSALFCLHMPFGTCFGIYLIYILTRPSVVHLFERASGVVPLETTPV